MENGKLLAEFLVNGGRKVHLIGVAGSGMSGIAGLLLALGHEVSGSDRVMTVEVERLKKLGLRFTSPHSANDVTEMDLVIYSSAIKPGNVAYDEAVRLGKRRVLRAEALAAILHCKKGIVVAGMHGKTTTSAMAAHVLRGGGLNPSHYVGAEIPILGTNAFWDSTGDYFVAEGDESDGTVALYHPEHTILLNVEEEHLDYYKNLGEIEAVYHRLLNQTHGLIFYSVDDANASRLCANQSRAISYGEGPTAVYRFQTVHSKAFRSQFKVFYNEKWLGDFILNVPGKHNISNATAVIALATELGIGIDNIAEAFESFRGARRRFEVKYCSDNYMVVDDYGHHPSEIRATVATALGLGANRLFVMFQPHRYSRTLALRDDFGRAFAGAEAVYVADVYPASETPIPGVSGQMIVDAIVESDQEGAIYLKNRKRIPVEIAMRIRPGDLVLSLGAGDIHEQAKSLAADLARAEELQSAMGLGGVRLYEPLSKHTTLRIGGPAQFWVEPETLQGFAHLVKHCKANGISLMMIGRGSNLLVRDEGIRGLVVHLSRGEFKQLSVKDGLITAGAGVKLKELSNAARDAGIGGFEWMEGIPGNVGGALRMNAGAMGGQMFGNVVHLNYVDQEGAFHTLNRDAIEANYRSVPLLINNYAVSAVFSGPPSSREQIELGIEDSINKRRQVQPRESSAGCVFKNPVQCPAGQLVDELGLKNRNVGQARVSELHGNFIVNDGGATAADVLALIEQIKTAARDERGIDLETEVQIVGETKGIHEYVK